jgi:hypothetical protein
MQLGVCFRALLLTSAVRVAHAQIFTFYSHLVNVSLTAGQDSEPTPSDTVFGELTEVIITARRATRARAGARAGAGAGAGALRVPSCLCLSLTLSACAPCIIYLLCGCLPFSFLSPPPTPSLLSPTCDPDRPRGSARVARPAPGLWVVATDVEHSGSYPPDRSCESPRGQRLSASNGPAEPPRSPWCNFSFARQQSQ